MGKFHKAWDQHCHSSHSSSLMAETDGEGFGDRVPIPVSMISTHLPTVLNLTAQ